MSLELIAIIEKKIPADVEKKIVIALKKNYDVVLQSYNKEESEYGFIKKGQEYQKEKPPLFMLNMKNLSAILSIFGNLNDYEIIVRQISSIFNSHGVNLLFEEE